MSDLNLQMILENIQEMKEEQLDEINAEFQKAAENQKEEVLPDINECQKCGEPLPKGQGGTKCINCLL